jgi:sugar lactone lactonase YvrE
MAVVALDPKLNELVDADVKIEQISTGHVFTEGPIWSSRDKSLIFSCIRSSTQYVWTEANGAKVFRQPSNEANGNTYDINGNLITCEHTGRRIAITKPGGQAEDLVAEHRGRKFNSPNDVVGMANGDLIFTDPTFGLRQPDGSIAGAELQYAGLFRIRPNGELTLLNAEFDAPNGLVVTDDQKTLLVDDTRHSWVRGFAIHDDGSLHNMFHFCDVKRGDSAGRPDGMKLDSLGNLYVTANTDECIWVYNPEGKLLGFIGLPERPANCAWGGDDWQTLFVTAQTSVYRLRMKVAGQKVIGQ